MLYKMNQRYWLSDLVSFCGTSYHVHRVYLIDKQPFVGEVETNIRTKDPVFAKPILFRIFLLLSGLMFHFVTGLGAIKISCSQYGIRPDNSPMQNTRGMKLMLKALDDSVIHIIFDKGIFLFAPDSLYTGFKIAPKSGQQLCIQGQGEQTVLATSVDEASGAFQFFKISSSPQIVPWKVTFQDLVIEGPRRYGKLAEKNPRTTAILLEGGSGELNVERVRIRGCFFTGILGSGAGNQTVRINHCIIEQSSNIGAGLFGTGFEKHFICHKCDFLRNGIPGYQTQRGKAYGASIYCHPNVNIRIDSCRFFNNGRNAIQLASGSGLYYQKYVPDISSRTRYQIFESNYFDSTCHDGIQLGFFFPHAIVRKNVFNNRAYAIQGLIGATIEENLFNQPVIRAIDYKLDFKANEEDSIRVLIKNNIFYSSTGVTVANCVKEAKFYQILSVGNRFRVNSTAFTIGSAYTGDSSLIYLHSVSDTFFTTIHGCVSVAYNNIARIDSAVVYGNAKFIVIPKQAREARTEVNTVRLPDQRMKPQLLFAPNSKYSDTNATVIFRGVPEGNKALQAIQMRSANSKHVLIEFQQGQSPISIPAQSRIGKTIGFNFDTYQIQGPGSIREIYLFDAKNDPEKSDWEDVLTGTLHLKALSKFTLEPGGNIQLTSTVVIPKGETIRLEWNRVNRRWNLVVR